MKNDQHDEKLKREEYLTHAARNDQQVILLSTYRITPPFNSSTKEEYDPPLLSLMRKDEEV